MYTLPAIAPEARVHAALLAAADGFVTTWLDCSLVCSRGRLLPALPDPLRRRVLAYLDANVEGERHNIWHDRLCDRCFSAAETRGLQGRAEFHFNDSEDGFLVRKWGLHFVRRAMAKFDAFRTRPLVVNSEVVYASLPCLADVAGSRILIVLGGPSTNAVEWWNLDADQVWSCNHFYKHERLRRRALDLVALGPNVRLDGNRELEDYFSQHPTSVLFELQKVSDVAARDAMRNFVAKHPDRCTFAHLRYASFLGIGSRLVCLAILLGARAVYVVGLDSISTQGPGHCFEPYKPVPGWYLRHGEHAQRRQLVVFWEYLMALCSRYQSRVFNLGELCPDNRSASISRQISPLPGELRHQVVADRRTADSGDS